MTDETTVRAPLDELTGLEAARLGLYVHFPYCLSKCPYCDFASTVARSIPQEDYTRAILDELERRVAAHGLAGATVDSVFLGGGTPSLWEPHHVGRVLERTRALLRLGPDAEVTLEANPGASDVARFAGYRAAGVNRLSLGVQSFQADTLSRLGRSHDGAAAVAAVAAARRAGFQRLSVDLIYGVHGQTLESWQADVAQGLALETEHLSAYALTLDREVLAEEVPLSRQLQRGELQLPPDEVVVAMQREVAEAAARHGLERYEVSNHAVPGRHSRHNALYWTGGDCLALGTGAVGTLGGARYTNHRSAERYLAAVGQGELPQAGVEALAPTQRFNERVALGLRLTSGVDVAAAGRRWGVPTGALELAARQLVHGGLAWWREGRLALTPRGLDVHSAIAARLMAGGPPTG